MGEAVRLLSDAPDSLAVYKQPAALRVSALSAVASSIKSVTEAPRQFTNILAGKIENCEFFFNSVGLILVAFLKEFKPVLDFPPHLRQLNLK